MQSYSGTKSPLSVSRQNQQHTPCVPALARGLSQQVTRLSAMSARDLRTFTTNLLKSQWFCEVALEHHAIHWAIDQSIYIDRMALCQHYGIPTGYLDLTQSFDVAMFFATSRYLNGSWQPMTEGLGIVYFFDYQRYLSDRIGVWSQGPRDRNGYGDTMRELEERFAMPGANPIGYQPMPRPAEQWAWGFKAVAGQDFEQLPYVSAISFAHSQHLSEKYLHRFKGGRALFPKDPTSEVAAKILDADIVPSDYVEPILDYLHSDLLGITTAQYEQLKDELKSIARPNSDLPTYTADRRAQLARAWTSKSRDFFKSVGWTLVRTTESGRLEVRPTVRAFDEGGNPVVTGPHDQPNAGSTRET
jgi:FRG domain